MKNCDQSEHEEDGPQAMGPSTRPTMLKVRVTRTLYPPLGYPPVDSPQDVPGTPVRATASPGLPDSCPVDLTTPTSDKAEAKPASSSQAEAQPASSSQAEAQPASSSQAEAPPASPPTNINTPPLSPVPTSTQLDTPPPSPVPSRPPVGQVPTGCSQVLTSRQARADQEVPGNRLPEE